MRSIRESKVCVIGGAGFLGSHLVDHLIDDRKCEVLVVDNLVTGAREFVHPSARFVHHDITGSESYMRRLLDQYQIEYVFNYAAWPYVPDSFSRPLQVFNVNATGAIQVINAASESRYCRGILQVSSAELYGSAGTTAHAVMRGNPLDPDSSYQVGQTETYNQINEYAKVEPHSTYGAAKAAVDYYCQCAARERGVQVIALRQFNCLGERETHPYVIPEIISQISRGDNWTEYNVGTKTPQVRLGNNSFRDFLYAGDQARMATELLERGEWGQVYNLGSETGVKIYDLARMIGEVMGYDRVEVIETHSKKRPWEIWHLQSDNHKLYGVIESRPSVSLRKALERTVKWFVTNGGKWPWEAK